MQGGGGGGGGGVPAAGAPARLGEYFKIHWKPSVASKPRSILRMNFFSVFSADHYGRSAEGICMDKKINKISISNKSISRLLQYTIKDKYNKYNSIKKYRP